MNKLTLFHFSALAGAALVAAGPSARAQSAGAAGPQQAQPGTALSEVIVTAQRRSQRLEEVPISVTAIAGKDLAKSGVTGLRDLQTIAPSFQLGQSGVFTQLSIRGITSEALGPGIENNIAVYVDGFYEPDSSALGSDFANVSDIEVLKGPQGTLYGRNATGGALLVDTYEPSATHPIIEASVGYGNLNDRRARAYVSVPITSTLSFGIGAYYRGNDGYIKNINGSNAAPFSETDIRAKLKWEPTDRLSFVLGQNYFYKSDPVVLAFSEQAYSPLGLPVGPLFTNQIGKISMDPNPIFTVQQEETTLRAKWITDYGTFTSHTSYTDERPHFDNDYDGSTLHIQEIPAIFERHTFIEQVDYDVKPFQTLEIQAGGMYFTDESSDNATIDLLVPPITTTFQTFEQGNTIMKTTAYAGYIDATWQVIPNVYVNGGVRYSDDKRTVSGYWITNLEEQFYLNLGVPQALSPDPYYPREAPTTTVSFPSTIPSATIRWEFLPRTDIYASYSQGFKSGTFNTVAITPGTLTAPVQPEHITAYEVGFKTAHGPFHFEAATYYYDYRNLQVNALGTDPFTHQILVTLTNAAAARIYGFEASGAWAVTPNFNLRAAFAYTHARYASFPNGSASIPTADAAQCAAAGEPTPCIISTTQNFTGRRIARAPDETANIGGDYTIPLSVGKVVLAGNGYYTSKYAPLSEAFDPATGKALYYDDGYFLANASVSYVRDHYTVGVYVNDIGNVRFPILNQSNNFGYYKVLSSPRTYGVKIDYAY
jgi:iron complex outermembrane receptor protein